MDKEEGKGGEKEIVVPLKEGGFFSPLPQPGEQEEEKKKGPPMIFREGEKGREEGEGGREGRIATVKKIDQLRILLTEGVGKKGGGRRKRGGGKKKGFQKRQHLRVRGKKGKKEGEEKKKGKDLPPPAFREIVFVSHARRTRGEKEGGGGRGEKRKKKKKKWMRKRAERDPGLLERGKEKKGKRFPSYVSLQCDPAAPRHRRGGRGGGGGGGRKKKKKRGGAIASLR